MKRMKYVFTGLLLTALALGQSAPSPASAAAPSGPDSASKAKSIVHQGIEALGGPAYLNWQTQTSEGRSYSFHHGEANSYGLLFWRFRKFPDQERIEVTKKRDVAEIFTGDKGYEVTYKGVRELEHKQELDPYLRRHHYALDLVLRQWINEPGVAFFYEGQTVAAQKETDQVTIMNARNEAVTVNFDINTHLPVRKSFTWRDPTDKQRNVEEEIFDNYRRINGIMTPYDVTRLFNSEMSYQSFLTSAAYGENFDDSMFDPHAPQKREKHK